MTKLAGDKTTNTEAVQTLDDMRFRRDALSSWSKDVDSDSRSLLKVAGFVLLILFGFGGLWSITAPLGGAVVGSGKVIAVGQNRLVQHLEGGILSKLTVREGDQVKQGDILAELDTLDLESQLQVSRLQKALSRIELARLRAEVREQSEVSFPTDIEPAVANTSRVQEALDTQLDEFIFGLEFRNSSREIIDNQILGLKGDVEGREEVLIALNRQRELFEAELEAFRGLFEKGHIAITRVNATERQVVELVAQIANVHIDIQKARNDIINLETEKRQRRSDFLAQANARLLETQKLLNDFQSRVERLEDRVVRSVVRSPVDGTVFRIAKRTIGEIIKPGDTVMLMFPDNDALTIEAQLQPTDRNQVYLGQTVRVVFPSDKQQEEPVDGRLIYVSADTITSEQNPVGSYVIRVEVPSNTSPEHFQPGNLADVYIQTEPKTFLQIISEPITRFAFRAFKG
ncbi:HlyD family type I secretion periplasmic adaptor subunit [Kordiimonas aquimaris]|uniref:HlyD family type I secretion periplasmic adaptor subunit n=1 Tax=Kordiimonas aquimaris TaxID=707591 RepID=UPI0021CF30F4|nr:HlyD family type I secretion periplasmic adaptor subunit [Kordiimonas aquimaris]